MIATTWLLFVIACLGATDIVLFHTIAHGLKKHAPSRAELVSHSFRGPVYAALFLAVPNASLQGAWFWGLLALVASEIPISLWDFITERSSRAPLGGLPTGEYVLHATIALLYGAMITALIFEVGDWAHRPTRIAYEPAPVPDALRGVMAVMAIAVFVEGLLNARAAWRLGQATGADASVPKP